MGSYAHEDSRLHRDWHSDRSDPVGRGKVFSVRELPKGELCDRLLLVREKPNDRSASKRAHHYNYGSEIFRFLALDLPLFCYPPQEQRQDNANYRVGQPPVGRRRLQSGPH
jgi:hypothetical protein